MQDWVQVANVVLEDERPVHVDHVVQVLEEKGEEQRCHVAHYDLAELGSGAEMWANILVGHVNDVTQGDNFAGEFAVGRHVDLLKNSIDEFDAVFVGDDVELDWHSTVY